MKKNYIDRAEVDKLTVTFLGANTDNNVAFYEHMMDIPPADVVEQEKIDEALDETYKIRNEILQANGCYEPNDVIDIIDQITKLFEEI